jgi:host factor-I protein
MIRLTRDGKPNLFIYKQQIRTIREHARRNGNHLSNGEEENAP